MAKTTDKIDLKALASMPSFYQAVVNHANTEVAFFWDKTGKMEMYILNLESREIRQVTDGEGPTELRTFYHWSRDDTKLIFGKDAGGNEKHDLFSLDTTTKELIQLTNTPDAVEHINDTSPDGKWITFSSNRNGQMNIYKSSILGGEATQLTAHEQPVSGGSFSPDGKLIAYNCNEEDDLKNSDIYFVTADGESVERIIQNQVGSREFFGFWLKDGSGFTFTTDVDGIQKAGIYSLKNKDIRYFGDGKHELVAGRISENGKYFSCMEFKDGSVSLAVFDLQSNERKRLQFPPGIAAGTRFIDDRHIILLLNSPTSPSSLVSFDIEENSTDILIDVDTGDVDKSLFVQSEHIHYQSFDGLEIPAIIYKPQDFDLNKKYPAIVHAHGGPTGQFFMIFSIISQYFVNLGYVVIEPNVRGSTGYGKEFMEMNINDLGGADLKDWNYARKYLIDHMSADPNKIGIYGGSYGGYATLIAMTRTPDLWNAGVAAVPISSWVNLYKDSMEHFKFYLKMLMGDPVENKGLWEERSPLNYVENVSAPLLLIHGENDPRCPVSESRNFVEGMEKAGKKRGQDGDFEYIEYTDIGHGSAGIDFKVENLKNTFDFFERRLR